MAYVIPCEACKLCRWCWIAGSTLSFNAVRVTVTFASALVTHQTPYFGLNDCADCPAQDTSATLPLGDLAGSFTFDYPIASGPSGCFLVNGGGQFRSIAGNVLCSSVASYCTAYFGGGNCYASWSVGDATYTLAVYLLPSFSPCEAITSNGQYTSQTFPTGIRFSVDVGMLSSSCGTVVSWTTPSGLSVVADVTFTRSAGMWSGSFSSGGISGTILPVMI